MRWSRSDWLAAGLAVCGVLLVALERAPVAEQHGRVKARSDAFLLPPADQTYVASLGYRSALADLIFGHVLVSYGLHFQRRQLFEHVGDYLDVINRLDPGFRAPYAVADTLLTMQPQVPPADFYRRARKIQERGLAQFPTDQALWSSAGQFVAYLAAGQMKDPAERREYEETGAKYLMRACDLIGSDDAIPYHCIVAANLLTAQGSREAARQFLERVLTVSDDPGLAKLAGGYLQRIYGEEAQAKVAARQARFVAAWHSDLPSSPRVEVSALSPRFDPAECAGRPTSERAGCATSWREWSTQHQPPGHD